MNCFDRAIAAGHAKLSGEGKRQAVPAPNGGRAQAPAIKKCHQTLCGGGRLSPPSAFGELCKIIFVKISDEQAKRKKGELTNSKSKPTNLTNSNRCCIKHD